MWWGGGADFNLESTDCDDSDTELCQTELEPMDVRLAWLLLGLAVFYALSRRLQDHVDDLLVRYLDLISPRRAAQRQEWLASTILFRRRRLARHLYVPLIKELRSAKVKRSIDSSTPLPYQPSISQRSKKMILVLVG